MKQKWMIFWNSLVLSMIQQILKIWSMGPLLFLNPPWISGSSQFMYCWSLAQRIWGLLCRGVFSSAQFSLTVLSNSVTPWTTAGQASLSITNCWSLPKPMSIESVMPTYHLMLCRPLLLLPSIPPSIRVFSNKLALRIRWPEYWSFSFSISPSNEHPGLISFRMDWSPLGWTGWISLQSKGLSRVFSNTTVQKHQFFSTQLSLQSNSHIHTWPLEKP